MISEERIKEILTPIFIRQDQASIHWPDIFEEVRAIEAEVRAEAQEPVAWFVFADNNGPVPLELWGFDLKACKNAVLENARSIGWKGTVEGQLFQMGWTIRPLYTAPRPPAPCPDSVSMANWLELTSKYSEATQLIVDLQAKVAEQAERIKVLEEDVTHYKSEAHDAGMSRVQIGKLQDKIEKLNLKLQIDNTIIGDFDARCKELELKIAKLKTPPIVPQWVRDLEVQVQMSSMRHAFTFSRDETMYLMGISMEIQAAFHALKTENESLVPIKEALAKAKLALDSCDVNDTQFPLDTQYYDRELVDEAISIIEKLPK